MRTADGHAVEVARCMALGRHADGLARRALLAGDRSVAIAARRLGREYRLLARTHELRRDLLLASPADRALIRRGLAEV